MSYPNTSSIAGSALHSDIPQREHEHEVNSATTDNVINKAISLFEMLSFFIFVYTFQ